MLEKVRFGASVFFVEDFQVWMRLKVKKVKIQGTRVAGKSNGNPFLSWSGVGMVKIYIIYDFWVVVFC